MSPWLLATLPPYAARSQPSSTKIQGSIRCNARGFTLFNIRAEKCPFQTPISAHTDSFGIIFKTLPRDSRRCFLGGVSSPASLSAASQFLSLLKPIPTKDRTPAVCVDEFLALLG